MPSVDNRVVQMQFDNAQFEKKMGETIASLEKFREQLDFTKVSGDLGKSLTNSLNGFSTAAVTSGIEDVSNRFVALKSVVFTVVSEITQSLLGLGRRLATELIRPDQIIQGFSEYELKMNSIQTIMASSGADLAVVNQKLQELNEYSDRTIYSFADMTQNIGKFTNAGVSLDQSVAAIQGVANVAAVSGASAEEAARSMYNFSQALSSGSVRLEDWRSIELANMGTMEFKQQLIDAGEALGTLTRQGDGWVTAQGTFVSATKGFRESLTDQWLTSEVLVDTLNDYSDTTTEIGKKAAAAATEVKTFTQLFSTIRETMGSGWAQSFEVVIGNLEEAKSLFASIGNPIRDFISANAEARNALLQGWKDAGGRTLLIESLGSAFKSLGAVLKTIGDAFKTVFPPATAQTLMNLTQGFAAFVARLKPSEGTLENIQKLFTGLFSVVKLLVTVGGGLIKFFASIFSTLAGGSGGLFAVLGGFGDLLTLLSSSILSSGAITRLFEGLAVAFVKVRTALQPFINILGMLLGYLAELAGRIGSQVGNVLENVFGKFPGVFDKIIASVGAFGTELEQAFKQLFSGGGGDGGAGGGGIFSGLADTLKSSWDSLVAAFESLDFSGFEGITGRISDRLRSIGEPFTKIFGFFVDAIGAVAEGVAAAGQWIADGIGSFVENLSSVLGGGDFSALNDLINAGLIGGVLYFLKKFADEGLKLDFSGGLFDKMGEVLDGLTGSLKTMQLSLKADALQKIAVSVGILAGSMLVLALIDSAALTKALVAMSTGMANLVTALVVLDKVTGTGAGIIGMAFSLNLLATSMLIFAGAVALFGTMDIDTLVKGISSIAVLLTTLVVFARIIEANADAMAKAGGSLVPFGVGLVVLSKAVERFSKFEPAQLAVGLLGLAGTLVVVVKALNAMPENLVSTGAGLILFGFALEIIAHAVGSFAEMSVWDLAKGILAMSIALQGIAVALDLMPAQQMVATGAGLILVGVALNLIARAVAKIGEMGVGQMVKGIAGLVLILVPLAVALQLMQGTIAGSAALLVAAVALSIFATVIKTFAKIKLGDLVKGLLGIVAVLAVLGLASLALSAAVPAMLAVGAALLVLGAGFALIGAAAYLVARSFQVFGEVAPEAFDNIIKAVKTFVQVLPSLLTGIAEGLLAFIRTFLDGIPELIGAVGQILNALLDEFTKLIPKLLVIAGLWIAGIIQIIRDSGPDLIAAGFELLMAWLSGLRDNINEITTVVGEIIVEFLTALAAKMPDIITASYALLVSFIEGITANLSVVGPAVGDLIVEFLAQVAIQYPRIIEAGAKLLGEIIKGIANALGTLGPAARKLIERLVTELVANIGLLADSAVTLLVGFVSAIERGAYRLRSAAIEVILKFLEGLGDNFVKLARGAADLLVEFMRALRLAIDEKIPEIRAEGLRLAGALINGMTGGIIGKLGDLKSAIGDTFGKALSFGKGVLGISSPSRITQFWGEMLVAGLATGLEQDELAVRAAKSFTQNIADAMEFSSMQPTITPVLDLSEVRAGMSSLSSDMAVSAYRSAATIADYASTPSFSGEEVTLAGASEVVFNQTINAPKALNTAEIYRQTRSQLAIAKQELAIR